MSRYDLKFGNTWLSEFGAVCTEEPPIEIAQRDFTLVDIPGKDGSDCIDNGRYLNVEMTRTIAMVGRKVSTAQEKAIQLVNNFAYLQGYQTFEDTHHNGLVTEAVLTNFEDVIRTLRTMRTATLKFSRKPYWYLKEAHEEQEVSLNSTFTLVNPYPSTACPTFVFKVNTSEHSSDSTTHINITISSNFNGVYSTKTFAIRNAVCNYNYPFVVVDTENQRVFSRNANGEKYKFADCDIPEPIGPGETVITLPNSVEFNHAYIAPNWRCL